MTDKTIENRGKVGGEYFYLKYSRKSTNNIQYYLNKFNIDDYFIYKSTNKFRQVTVEEFYDFKYSGYILFRKDKFDNDYINEQIQLLYQIRPSNTSPQYFNNPLPSIYFLNKIQKIKPIL